VKIADKILRKFKGHAVTLKDESCITPTVLTYGTMPNKYTAKITVKMRKSKMLHFAMKI